MMRRVRAKVVISEGLTVVVGMNETQRVGSTGGEGSCLSAEASLEIFLTEICDGAVGLAVRAAIRQRWC